MNHLERLRAKFCEAQLVLDRARDIAVAAGDEEASRAVGRCQTRIDRAIARVDRRLVHARAAPPEPGA